MAYIIADPCVSTCDTACVEVCPVDCIHGPDDKEGAGAEAKEAGFDPTDKQLYINPEECIDCGVCEPECPVDAIEPDTNDGISKMLEINKKYSELWHNILKKRPEDVPKDEAKWRTVKDKLKYISEKPGSGS